MAPWANYQQASAGLAPTMKCFSLLISPCRLMALPPPEADELGRVVWPGTPADVSRAYRRLSLLVHPDKNPGPEAQAAFEALKQSHKLLKEPGELVRPKP